MYKQTFFIFCNLFLMQTATAVEDVYMFPTTGTVISKATITSPSNIIFTQPTTNITCSPNSTFRGLYPSPRWLNYQFYSPFAKENLKNEYQITIFPYENLKLTFSTNNASRPNTANVNRWGVQHSFYNNEDMVCTGDIATQPDFPTLTSDFDWLQQTLKVNWIGDLPGGQTINVPETIIGYYGYAVTDGRVTTLPFNINEATFKIVAGGSFVIPSNTCTMENSLIDLGNIKNNDIIEKKINLNLSCHSNTPNGGINSLNNLAGSEWSYKNLVSTNNGTNLKGVSLEVYSGLTKLVNGKKYLDIKGLNDLKIVVNTNLNAQAGKLKVPLRFTLTYS